MLAGMVAVAKVENRNFVSAAWVAVRAVRHCCLHSSSSRSLRLILLTAALAGGSQWVFVKDIAGWIPDVVVGVKKDVGKKCWVLVGPDWDMAVMVVGTALGAQRTTLVADHRAVAVTGNHRHTLIEAVRMRLKEARFQCSSFRQHRLARLIVCWDRDLRLAVGWMQAGHTWCWLDCMCLRVAPQAYDHSIEQQ